MCNNINCRSFLWGGTGYHVQDDADGLCFCVCDDDSWSRVNMFGLASCVPKSAHLVYGWVGLAVSVVVLCHAVHHIRRQITFHAQNAWAATSENERCRRQMHIVAISVGAVHVCFFSLVLRDVLWWAFVVMMTGQIPVSIGIFVSTLRMWIYTNDPLLLRESPAILRASTWLEKSRGNITAHCVASALPCVGIVLALDNYTISAMRVVALGGELWGLQTLAVIWICGRSLIRAIDNSLQQQAGPTEIEGTKDNNDSVGGDPTLLAAKRSVARKMNFILAVGVPAVAVGAVATCSKYGIEAPIVMFGIPYTISSQIWMTVHVQLHTGRSSPSRRRSNGRRLSARGSNRRRMSAIVAVT